MTYFLFAGDMLVMAFMVALVIWVYMRSSNESIDASARIPLEDEHSDG
jgi:cbb3-type cytochrome oxidase subunit 3